MDVGDNIDNLAANECRFTIGQMADFCGVTRKTLRVYHEKGLVLPSSVDDSTGYRYYSLDQIVSIDRIARLQNLGFSLGEISAMLDADYDDDRFARLYEQLYQRVLNDLASLSMARDQLADILTNRLSCGAREDEGIFCKWVPEQRYVSFDLGKLSYNASVSFNEAGVRRWYCILAEAKRYFRSRGVPEIALNEISTMISVDDLKKREFRVSKVCVFINDDVSLLLDAFEKIEGGYVLVRHTNSFFDEYGNYNETASVRGLLEYADEHAMEPREYYTGVGNIDSPLESNRRTKDFLRFRLPVRKIPSD